jgi:hypothetical protein
MAAIKELTQLLASLSPRLTPLEYVFCHIKEAAYGAYAELSPIASYCEEEGLTLVLTKAQADLALLTYQGVFRCITLDVYSDLEAVGLTAAVAGRLAEAGISANVMAAYHHDHIYVPAHHAEQALLLLKSLA